MKISKFYNKNRLIQIFIILIACNFVYGQSKNINLILRLDDYSAKTPINVERQLFADLQRYNIKLTIGVIPFIHNDSITKEVPLSQEKFALLNEYSTKEIIEIAQHGYNHKNYKSHFGEFKNQPYKIQEEKIKKGKDFLERNLNQRIESFIPPFNRYDKNTIKILIENNFNNISANFKGTSIDDTKFYYFPKTCNLFDIKDVVKELRKISDLNPSIIVVFHYPTITNQESYDKFVSLMEWISLQPDINSSTINDLNNRYSEFDFRTYRNNQRYLNSCFYLIPPYIFPTTYRAILSKDYLKNKIKQNSLIILFFYILLLIITILISYLLRFISMQKLGKIIMLKPLYTTFSILSGIIVFRIIRDGSIHYNGLIFITIILGILLSFTIKTRRIK